MIAGRANQNENVAKFGSYTLGRRIGSGGMASVFAARQESRVGVGRLVALKLLHGSITADPTHTATFRREALLATRLEHPGIIRTYEVGEEDGQFYISMELVWGTTLSIAKGKVASALALRIILEVAKALEYAHDLRGFDGKPIGLVHQDVTPQNVMIGYDGRVRLLDFGVARLTSIDTSRTDHVRGKPAYLAPEQLEGRGLDGRVDIFALGIVAFELLTGARLFRRETIAATHHAVLSDPIPDIRDIDSGLPERISLIVSRALRRDPEDRWPDAKTLRESIERASRDIPLALASDTELATWASEIAPPSYRPGELEREIIEGTVARAEAARSSAGVVAASRSDAAFDQETQPPDRVLRSADTIVEELNVPNPAPSGARFEPEVPTARLRLPDYAAVPSAAPLTSTTSIERKGKRRGSTAALIVVALLIVGIPAISYQLIFNHGKAVAAGAPSASSSGIAIASPPPPSAGSDPWAPLVSATPSVAIDRSVPPGVSPPPALSGPSAPSASPAQAGGDPRLAHRTGGAAPISSATSAPANLPPAAETGSATASGAAAAHQPGTINVWSRVTGKLFVDGAYKGETPVANIILAPGSHSFRVATDQGEETRAVLVHDGDQRTERFQF